MALRPLHAFLISFAIGFISGFAFGAFFGSFLGAALSLGIISGVLSGIVFGVVGLGFFYVSKVLGRTGLLTIAVTLFVLGIITIQPEIDTLALIPLAIALLTGRRRK